MSQDLAPLRPVYSTKLFSFHPAGTKLDLHVNSVLAVAALVSVSCLSLLTGEKNQRRGCKMPHSLHAENYPSFTSLSFFTVPFIPVCPEHLHTFELGETASRQAPFPPVKLWPCCIKLRQCVCASVSLSDLRQPVPNIQLPVTQLSLSQSFSFFHSEPSVGTVPVRLSVQRQKLKM